MERASVKGRAHNVRPYRSSAGAFHSSLNAQPPSVVRLTWARALSARS